jgi:hypothetical protein
MKFNVMSSDGTTIAGDTPHILTTEKYSPSNSHNSTHFKLSAPGDVIVNAYFPAISDYGNCYPFGCGSSSWGPYIGFVYDFGNFAVSAGDSIGFDFRDVKGKGLVRNIHFAYTAAALPSSGTLNIAIDASSVVSMVSNNKACHGPAGQSNWFGDTIEGNFDCRWTLENSFTHIAGRGFFIIFSGGDAFAQGRKADPSNTGGLLHARFYNVCYVLID